MGAGRTDQTGRTSDLSIRGSGAAAFLLIGPYDPTCGEYTFLAPPLGVWRLAGVLEDAGFEATVFDPNCCGDEPPERALDRVLAERDWTVIGSSTTGMTLVYDLALAHRARRAQPHAVLVAGGMEATFDPPRMFELGPWDLVVLGEGERPLIELGERLRAASGANRGADLAGIAGTAEVGPDGVVRHFQPALTRDELRDAIFATPYEKMPYPAYWQRLEEAYRVGALPFKAAREARLAEIRSVRLITLNYCPMNCTFCSSTNFLHAAQGGIARLGRLGVDECMTMIRRIVATQPGVRTVIFQDDIFVFTADDRILPLCQAIVDAKREGSLPADLGFISTNRIDAMSRERLEAMRGAGFRVLGFGIESFSLEVLREFNKKRIFPHIEPNLRTALELGLTPFLDLILTSPRCRIEDLAETVRRAYRWILDGCEVGMYPYIIPFSGAAMAADPELEAHTVYARRRVAGTAVAWDQAAKILPVDPTVREAILEIERRFERGRAALHGLIEHLPSRLRSLVWVVAAAPVLRALGQRVPSQDQALDALLERLPGILDEATREGHRHRLVAACGEALPAVAPAAGVPATV